MEMKEEIILLVQDLASEAKYGWAIRDGLASSHTICEEQSRINRACEKIVKYIKEHK